MSAEASGSDSLPEAFALPGCCPICGCPNRCRLDSGEAYKGPCWCERPTVSPAALRRLLGDLPAPRCLCAGCLEAIAEDPEISREALRQTRRGAAEEEGGASSRLEPGDYYWEGAAMVFTAQFHLRRGFCCGSGCRHCPFR